MAISADPLNMVICGVGGQGNILLSGMLGNAYIRKGYFATIGETFGAAQRGGAVFSAVRISEKREYGPLIAEGKAHIIVGLEPLETLRMVQKYANPETLCISNVYPVTPAGVAAKRETYPDIEEAKNALADVCARTWFLDATSIALELGAPIAMNIVMVGALLGTGLLSLTEEDIKTELKASLPPDRLELNFQALARGMKAVEE